MISIRNYFTAFILIVMVFFMFMFVGVSASLLSDTSTNLMAEEKAGLGQEATQTVANFDLDTYVEGIPTTSSQLLKQKKRAAILSGGPEDADAAILTEWCIYNKYLYKIYTSLPEKDEISEYDIILFGGYPITETSCDLLYEYANMGITMIFTRLPAYSDLTMQKKLSDFFGIRTCVQEEIIADGIKIFSDFMINKERIYQKGDYYGEEDDTKVNVPYYYLEAGYEVYSVGLIENQRELGIKDEELPPLLWRTKTGNSFLFVINSDIYGGVALLGVLNGFMSRESECFLYPIVNAQTISLVNYPYLSKENEVRMQELYSRSSEAVARDLLWPNIIQILMNYGNSYSFFMSPQLDYLDAIGPRGDFTDFYLREIRKLPGDMGLSLGQVSSMGLMDILSEDEIFFKQYLENYEFTALYTADFSREEVEGCLDHEILNSISLIMSDYRAGDKLIDFIGEDTLSVKFNMDGYRHETMDDLRMVCMENALGMCNTKVDIKRVIFPQGSMDEWNYLSLRWSKGDTYYNDFRMLDMISIYELEKRVRRFMTLDFTYQLEENNLDISIDNFDEEAYFILRIGSRGIAEVENGTIEKMAEASYIVKALDSKVRIRLSQENVLEKPMNGKIIPY